MLISFVEKKIAQVPFLNLNSLRNPFHLLEKDFTMCVCRISTTTPSICWEVPSKSKTLRKCILKKKAVKCGCHRSKILKQFLFKKSPTSKYYLYYVYNFLNTFGSIGRILLHIGACYQSWFWILILYLSWTNNIHHLTRIP